MGQQENNEAYWARHKEAEKFVTSIKGPRPAPTETRDSIFGATAGGVSAMLALALAGVHGERFDYITLAVAGISFSTERLAKSLDEPHEPDGARGRGAGIGPHIRLRSLGLRRKGLLFMRQGRSPCLLIGLRRWRLP